MRRSNESSLGDLIDGWLKNHNKHSPIVKAHVVNRWEDYVGKMAARYTDYVKFDGDRLIVKMKSAVARRELEMIKTPLIEKINQEAGSEVVADIEFSS